MATDTSQYLNKWVEQKASYNKRDLLLYAVGIGCEDLRYVYEYDSDFAAFPTYPVLFGFKGTDQDVISFPSPAMQEGPSNPPLEGIKAGLDGERYIEMINPLPADGAELTLKTRLIGVHKRGSGASVEMEQLVSGSDGTLYYRLVSGAFLVGAKNFTDSGETNSKKIDPPSRAPDTVVEMPVPSNQTHLYRLSGDYNPLHIDPNMAQMMGFKEPILHGLCSLGFSTRAVLQAYGENDASKFKSVRVRFASPVLPGNTLQVEMWKEGTTIIFQTKVKETGKVAINNACLELSAGAKM
mmetsp:Transcript_33070/g.72251  ORF Transcript_33070/g.72251 Transcript_33070/m.72251 type:complete len:296 (+) Transcript_33070:54-941(+)|eukprot:CAMPEP_0204253294 /NCGR_PEP_ID=MMETSP0468-20130131/1788_1 /ASSEMBLY_ACC=CAM_ASM_000383 /TAXON_ID=2969 /ORGANISM="Oxyrrhis marina" /LENGTH=295 /DNA_ID=CAMNT_0051226843 /DNA_START=49 /DNA_END=936 /DNA_ORIENTATION=-